MNKLKSESTCLICARFEASLAWVPDTDMDMDPDMGMDMDMDTNTYPSAQSVQNRIGPDWRVNCRGRGYGNEVTDALFAACN